MWWNSSYMPAEGVCMQFQVAYFTKRKNWLCHTSYYGAIIHAVTPFIHSCIPWLTSFTAAAAACRLLAFDKHTLAQLLCHFSCNILRYTSYIHISCFIFQNLSTSTLSWLMALVADILLFQNRNVIVIVPSFREVSWFFVCLCNNITLTFILQLSIWEQQPLCWPKVLGILTVSVLNGRACQVYEGTVMNQYKI